MIERNITRKAFPKMLVGLFVALFGDYGEYERGIPTLILRVSAFGCHK